MNKKIRALIVDDEELARRGLELRLQAFEDIEIYGQAANGRRALEMIEADPPDLVFLDIQMPGLSGFDVLKALDCEPMPAVVFVTAFDQFALDAFEAHALDYLLKPIEDERLSEAIQRVREQRQAANALRHRDRLLCLISEMSGRSVSLDEVLEISDSASPGYPEILPIRDGRQTVRVSVKDIEWIEAAGDYMCVHAEGNVHILRGTMKKLEQVLDPLRFQRIHRSTLVNLNRVKSLRPHMNGEYFLRLDCGSEVKLSRSYRDKLEHLLPAV